VTVDQLKPAVREAVAEQGACEADLGVAGGEGLALVVGMLAEVEGVRDQVAGPHGDVLDAVLHGGVHRGRAAGGGSEGADMRISHKNKDAGLPDEGDPASHKDGWPSTS
jgi:hypothetical protein